MKKVVFILLTMLACAQAYTQQLSANALLEMAGCTDYECISEKATTSGYKIEMNKETDAYKTYVFRSEKMYQNQSNADVKKPNMLELTLIKQDHSITLSYFTGSDKERDALLADFQNKGFSYVASTEDKMSVSDNVAVDYRSPQYPKLTLKVTSYHREKNKNAEKIDQGFDRYVDQGEVYDEYGFELQWLLIPPPSERHKNDK